MVGLMTAAVLMPGCVRFIDHGNVLVRVQRLDGTPQPYTEVSTEYIRMMGPLPIPWPKDSFIETDRNGEGRMQYYEWLHKTSVSFIRDGRAYEGPPATYEWQKEADILLIVVKDPEGT